MRRGLRNVLGFFKERVDMALEDKDEAAVSRIVAPSADAKRAGGDDGEVGGVSGTDRL